MALGLIRNRLFRWTPIVLIEGLLIFKMVQHMIAPPSFDILGWKVYLWLIGSVFLGGALAWGAYALYCGKKR